MTRFLRGAAFALLATIMTAGSASAVEIVFYHYQQGGNYKAFRTILDDFEAANPGIEVTDIFKQSSTITADV